MAMASTMPSGISSGGIFFRVRMRWEIVWAMDFVSLLVFRVLEVTVEGGVGTGVFFFLSLC